MRCRVLSDPNNGPSRVQMLEGVRKLIIWADNLKSAEPFEAFNLLTSKIGYYADGWYKGLWNQRNYAEEEAVRLWNGLQSWNEIKKRRFICIANYGENNEIVRGYFYKSIIPKSWDYGHIVKYPLQGRGQDEILNEEQKAEVLSRRRLGESVRSIGRAMGVSKSTIAKIKEKD